MVLDNNEIRCHKRENRRWSRYDKGRIGMADKAEEQ